MYMARSLLPNPLQVLIEANKNQPSGPTSVASLTNMVLEGADRPVPLETAESPDTKYLLSFKVVMNELRRFKHSVDFFANSSYIIESAAISAS